MHDFAEVKLISRFMEGVKADDDELSFLFLTLMLQALKGFNDRGVRLCLTKRVSWYNKAELLHYEKPLLK